MPKRNGTCDGHLEGVAKPPLGGCWPARGPVTGAETNVLPLLGTAHEPGEGALGMAGITDESRIVSHFSTHNSQALCQQPVASPAAEACHTRAATRAAPRPRPRRPQPQRALPPLPQLLPLLPSQRHPQGSPDRFWPAPARTDPEAQPQRPGQPPGKALRQSGGGGKVSRFLFGTARGVETARHLGGRRQAGFPWPMPHQPAGTRPER